MAEEIQKMSTTRRRGRVSRMAEMEGKGENLGASSQLGMKKGR
jgi:hypothetical protein